MRARAQALIKRAQDTLPARVLAAYGSSQAGNFALALAFAAFMAMFPLILGVLSIIGLAIRDPATEANVTTLVLRVFPATAQPELQSALHSVKQSAGWLGLVSLAGLIWSASSIFSTMEFALTQIFGTAQRDMLRQRLMGLVMMFVLVGAIVLIMVINGAAAFFPSQIGWVISFGAGALVTVGLLVSLYRFVPNRTFRLGEVLPGAVLAGVLIELLSFAFPIYAKIAGHFNTYGATFGLFFVLATWFYLLSQFILLGAVYNKLQLGHPDRPGIVASPPRESRTLQKSTAAIYEKQSGEPPPAMPRRSIFQRVALGLVVALAVAAGAVRRRKPKTSA